MKIATRYGIYLGLLSIIVIFAQGFGFIPASTAEYLKYANIIMLVAFIHMSVRHTRDKEYGGMLDIKIGMRAAFVTALVAGLIIAVTTQFIGYALVPKKPPISYVFIGIAMLTLMNAMFGGIIGLISTLILQNERR